MRPHGAERRVRAGKRQNTAVMVHTFYDRPGLLAAAHASAALGGPGALLEWRYFDLTFAPAAIGMPPSRLILARPEWFSRGQTGSSSPRRLKRRNLRVVLSASRTEGTGLSARPVLRSSHSHRRDAHGLPR